jgi:hypothetical protein
MSFFFSTKLYGHHQVTKLNLSEHLLGSNKAFEILANFGLDPLQERLSSLNSLTAMGGHDRPLFNKLRARVVSPQIFVRCQRLMARKIAQLFGLNHCV